MKGSLTIVGLGPGAPELITPAVTDALKDSTDIVGYSKYIERVKDASGKSFHPSDNSCLLYTSPSPRDTG